jgi:hypothetical protein
VSSEKDQQADFSGMKPSRPITAPAPVHFRAAQGNASRSPLSRAEGVADCWAMVKNPTAPAFKGETELGLEPLKCFPSPFGLLSARYRFAWYCRCGLEYVIQSLRLQRRSGVDAEMIDARIAAEIHI